MLAVSGGFRTTVGGLRISARSPLPLAGLALAAGGVWFVLARRSQSVTVDLDRAWLALEQHSIRIIVTVAIAVAVVAAVFATRSASGADASGYLSQAARWTVGLPPVHVEPLAAEFPELDGWMTTPLGWRPGPDGCAGCQGVQVPTYPPGLPLLMAVPHAIGGVTAAALAVVVSAVIAVLVTGLIATRLAGGAAGMLASLMLGASPVFLFQSIQPMSDVPVTAAWMTCFLFVLRANRSGGMSRIAGIACAIAVLIRPNLAPLALVPLFMAPRKVAFAIPVGIAGAFLAFAQFWWYGSPLRSGYGAADELFALSNIVPNTGRYLGWLVATSPVLVLGVLGGVRRWNERGVLALAGFAAMVVAAYLIYAVFDDWSYLRFLLPAMAVLAILAGGELSSWIGRLPSAVRAPLLFTIVLGLSAHALHVARSHDTFRLQGQVRRIAQVADFVAAHVPDRAVIVAGEQSGSMRYYTGRSILRWEAATPEALASAIGRLEAAGYPVHIVLDAWETGPFRAKFAAVPSAAIDWPAVLEAGTSHRTRLWKVGDRERFQRGENLGTIRLP